MKSGHTRIKSYGMDFLADARRRGFEQVAGTYLDDDFVVFVFSHAQMGVLAELPNGLAATFEPRGAFLFGARLRGDFFRRGNRLRRRLRRGDTGLQRAAKPRPAKSGEIEEDMTWTPWRRK
jgi:hypothetical protein